MKVKVDWMELGKLLWSAVRPVLLAAIGGGIVSFATGCSGTAQTPRGQTTEVVAFGVPAVAWISHTTQNAEQYGGDTNGVTQVNPVMTSVPVGGAH